jgi:urease accessory protein
MFACDQQERQTRMYVKRQQPPLKVIRAFPIPAGGVLVHLHNISGGVLGGDQLTMDVQIESDAYVQLTTTSATRLYRTPPGSLAACQTSTMRLAEGALLEYLPDPLIPFAGVRYQQCTTIELADQAGLFWWETIAPGRSARGEIFAYQSLDIGVEIRTPEYPCAIECMRLQPEQNNLTALARLGAYQYTTSFYICKVGVASTDWQLLERDLIQLARQLTVRGETLWGVSTLVNHGLVVKALSRRGSELPAGLFQFWQAAKKALYGNEAVLPRKIY